MQWTDLSTGSILEEVMSFIDNTKNFGILAVVVAVINVAGSVLFFINEDVEDIWRIIAGVGGIVSAALMLVTGVAIATKRIPSFLTKLFPEGLSSKFGVLTGYTAAIGVASIVGLGTNVMDIVAGVVIGLLLLFIVWILTNDRKGVIEKILWVILIVIYFLGILSGVVLAIEGSLNIVSGICVALMYLLAFLYLFDPSVKAKFGI